MKRFGKIALLAVIFLIVGGFFAWIPLAITPGTPTYHSPRVVCNELQNTNNMPIDQYTPNKTSKNGLPIPYTTYTGSCPPPSPNVLLPFIIDFIFGGILGIAAVRVLINRRKK